MSRTGPAELGRRLQSRRESLAVAESCTGGLLAKRITDIAGSSAWFERGLVTYSNRAKQELLGVSPDVLRDHGAVSRETVETMARGLQVMSPADWAVAITGIAGPGGATPGKPVGLVWIAWAHRRAGVQSRRFRFRGGRARVRSAAAEAAMTGLLTRLKRRG